MAAVWDELMISQHIMQSSIASANEPLTGHAIQHVGIQH